MLSFSTEHSCLHHRWEAVGLTGLAPHIPGYTFLGGPHQEQKPLNQKAYCALKRIRPCIKQFTCVVSSSYVYEVGSILFTLKKKTRGLETFKVTFSQLYSGSKKAGLGHFSLTYLGSCVKPTDCCVQNGKTRAHLGSFKPALSVLRHVSVPGPGSTYSPLGHLAYPQASVRSSPGHLLGFCICALGLLLHARQTSLQPHFFRKYAVFLL